MKVQDIMHRGATALEVDATATELARRMRDDDVGAIPIRENSHIVGVVTDRDIACRVAAKGADPDAITAGDIMTENPVFCGPEDNVADALELMQLRRIRRLPVMESGRLVGMLSLGDVCFAMDERSTVDTLRAVATHHA